MIRTYLLPLLAAAGFALGIFMVIKGNTPVPAAPPVAEPPHAAFRTFVAGSGLIESRNENIAIGSHVSGVVAAVHVQIGDRVKAGQPLFTLDDRQLKAEFAVREAAVLVAKAELDRLKAAPRPEEAPPVEARVKAAEAALADLQAQLTKWESITDQRAISREEFDRKRFAVKVAEAQLAQARADLTLAKSPTWKPVIDVQAAQVAAAESQAAATRVEIDRLTVRAPTDGRVLQVKIRPGEFAPAGVVSQPMILLGDVDKLRVRVDVDENDAWRIKPDAPAEAFARGNKEIKTPLKFVRFEPMIVPKRSLTGDSTERVDTRVLQVIYEFDRGDLPLFVGQQMDVFIEAPPIDADRAAATRPQGAAR